MSDTATLRTRIADELNRQPADIIGSPSLSVGLVINREINSAIRHYESTRFLWNETREATLFTTVSGTRNYSLPANFLRMDTIKLVYSSSYIVLKPRTWAEMEEKDRLVTGSLGVPADYVIHGTIVRLYPVANGAYTAIGSYMLRFPPTSLTGCYTAVIPMTGSRSFTVTTTASHHNRINGWTTDGEELIRERAKAAIKIRYFTDEAALTEMGLLQSQREPYLSVFERQAYERLADETNDALATGTIKPYFI